MDGRLPVDVIVSVRDPLAKPPPGNPLAAFYGVLGGALVFVFVIGVLCGWLR